MLRWVGDETMAAMVVEDSNGNRASLLVKGEVAAQVVAVCGAGAGGITGRRVEFEESAAGMVVRLGVLSHDAHARADALARLDEAGDA